MYLKTFGSAALEGTSLRRPKPLLLLGYLAAEGARSRQHLRELFWSGAADPAASLRVALRQIREAAPEALKEDNDILSLLIPSDVADLIAAFRTSPERVMSVYQGEFFNGLVLEKTDEESELGAWLLTTREHFAGQVRSSILYTAEEYLQQGDASKAAELVRQVRYLPGAKPLDAAELQKLYTLALQTGSELSGLLREEAAEFGASLSGLEEQKATNRRYELPRATTSFIGRHIELQELRALLKQDIRLLTIQGIGGVGKTRLALELAQLQGTEHLAFVQLSGVTEVKDLPLTIAQSMRLNLASGAPPFALITSAIDKDTFTLYLDNYEQLLPETQVIQDLLVACPNLRIVVTSRERLGLDLETLYPITGLDQSDGEHSDAARLFLSRARQANARFIPTPEIWSLVLDICKRLDGSPLAIELAAGWVRRMPIQQIAEELTRGLELLEAAGDGPGKFKSLRAIFEQSWAKLSTAEQQLLISLSVFRGGFTRASAGTVTDATLRPLLPLLDAAFLNVSQQGRYTQHPLLSHFVQEKAFQFSELLSAVETKFVGYFSENAWEIWQDYYGETEIQNITWGLDEYENIAAAIALAMRENNLISALKLCVFQAFSWQNRGLLREGAEQLEMVISQAKQKNLEKDPAYRWGLQVACNLRLWSGGWTEEVAQYLEEAKQLSRDAGDMVCLAQCLAIHGVRMGVTSKLSEAKGIFLQALKYVEGTDAYYEQGHIYVNLVTTCNNMGDLDAEIYLERGLELASRHKLERIRGHILFRRAELLIGHGLYVDAQKLLDEVEKIFTARHLTKDLSVVYLLRGLAEFFGYKAGSNTDVLDLAAADLQTSYRLRAGNVVNRTMDLLIPQIGDIYLAKGELDAAEDFFREGLAAAEQEDIKPLIINCSLGLGRTFFAQGKYSEALKYLKNALELTQMMAVWCIAADVAAAALGRVGEVEAAIKVWGKGQQEREVVQAFRYPVYSEYYEPEIQRIRKEVSDEQFQSLFETGRQLEKSEILALLSDKLSIRIK